mgnify:CR=1 FL=1|tara:strand:- start:1671 stop:3410 length:1740 start_codon:yes stop_codon:yes gene_type:complete
MSALGNALDSHTSRNVGWNGTAQHAWSHDEKEQIVQFFSQVTRTDKNTVRTVMAGRLENILKTLSCHPEKSYTEAGSTDNLLTVLYQMIGHTRDIISGKGEYELSYMMIHTWNKFFPELAREALKEFVISNNGSHPYGSWKDLKYMCGYCYDVDGNDQNSLIKFSSDLMLSQLKQDIDALDSGDTKKISLCARWAPREKTHFGWLFKIMAESCYSHWLDTAKSVDKRNSARRKAYQSFRTDLARLNKALDTTQIKQCSKEYSQIDIKGVTSITLRRQNRALRNVDKTGRQRSSDPDRVKCAENFTEFMAKAVKGEAVVKGKRVSLIDFVKDALNTHDNVGKDVLNLQWQDNSKLNDKLKNVIAMVDTSGSMTMNGCVPLYSALGLGCRIAEKSSVGRRVMTFSARPTWVNLEYEKKFTDMVAKIRACEWGMNTNFGSALRLILDVIVQNRLSVEDVENMVLVILSDMQIDCAETGKTMFEFIEQEYHAAGMKVHGKPYSLPHIVFWNLNTTSGTPVLSSTKNTSMMSGSSPALLQQFCDNGIEALRGFTPWKSMLDQLNNERYEILKNHATNYVVYDKV